MSYRTGLRAALALVLAAALPAFAQADGKRADVQRDDVQRDDVQRDDVQRETVGNRTSESIPPIPASLLEQLNRYQNFRGAELAGWTRDGCLLVSTRFGETAQVHRVCQPLGMREQLTFYPEPVSGIVPAPARATRDGFVFAKDKGGDEFSQLYWFDAATRDTTLLTDGGRNQNKDAIFSADGGLMSWTSTARNGTDHDVWLRDTRTGKARLLVDTGGLWTATGFSPDGSRLLVMQYVSAAESHPGVVDVASGKLTLFPVDGGKAAFGDFTFAPDGNAVYFVSDEPLSDVGGQSKPQEFQTLRFHDPATGKFEVLTAAIPWDVETFRIADDGRHLAFVVNEDGVSKLHVLALPSHAEIALPALPTGVIGALAFSPDGGRLAVAINSATSPSDVHVIDLAKDTVTRWTASEVGGMDASKFVAPTVIHYPSFDGRSIPAFLYKPAQPAKHGKYPVVIRIHGGPEGQARPVFTTDIQITTNALGVAVLQPNVRGSAGYGKTYVALDNGAKREDSVKDIGALLDWIATQPDLDASRVGVIGGSYGGYMTLASLVHYSDRIRAATELYGVSDFTSFLQNTESYRRDLRRAEYGDERDPAMNAVFQRISPLNNVARIKTPLFVAQGRNDPRVPMSEAGQIVKAVRGNGQPVWYVLFNDEGHGFRKKVNNDYFNAATMLFWQHYLLNDDAPVHAQSAAPAAPATSATPAAPATPARLTIEPMLAPSGPADVVEACDRGLATAATLRAALENDPAAPGLDTFRQFDDLSMVLAATRRDADLVASTSPDEAIRNAARECMARAAGAEDAVQLSRTLHDRLQAIPQAARNADPETRYVLERTLARFDRAGVSRDAATRERIAAVNQAITALQIKFAENIANGRRTVTADPSELEGLPADYIAAHKPGADGKVVISTDYPDLLPVLTYARSDALRKRLWTANNNRAYPENDVVLGELIAQRDALARLLGRANFASLHLEDAMLQSPAAVQAFLDELLRVGDAPARRDNARMLARLRQEQPGATAVPMWDDAYLTQAIKKEQYDLDPQEVRRYFAYDNVRNGILQLTRDLMGVEIRPWKTPVWDPSVEAYEMLDGGVVIGRFYFDTHPRKGKFTHAEVIPIRMGVVGGSIPVAALVTNFPAGGHGTGLMEHRDVEVFLHEYGHLIHAMLSGGKRYSLSGMGGLEGDFIEAPSKMLENFVWDYDTLARFAVDEQGRTIPRELVERMNGARYFGEALRDRRQLSLANASLSYYLGPPEGDLATQFSRAYDKYALESYPVGVHPQDAFPHLAPQSASYYKYMWSQTLALDMFSRFENEGVRNQAVARDYRQKVLAPGGTRPAAALVEDFLGRPPSLEAYRARLARDQ